MMPGHYRQDTIRSNPSGDRLLENARRHDLKPSKCRACDGGTSIFACGNCGGSGRIWHAVSGASLCDAGVLRLDP